MEPQRRFRDALIPSRLRIVLLILGFTLALVLAPERRAVAEIVEYRSIDGTGNNIAHPNWGAAGATLLRGPSGAHYGDGSKSMGGATRPSPRAVSNAFFAQTQSAVSSAGHSDYIWAWGQFLDHDLGLTPGANKSEPIPVPQGDPFFDPFGTGTQLIPFNRHRISTI